ncbi:MAG: hypothetical protein AB7J35_02885 [Dehalococcoidia bacterium]
MARSRGLFGPTERALEFGKQYTVVLEAWAEFFAVSAKLTGANVKLGELAQDAAKDWEKWVNATATAPWNWMNPEVMARMMGGVTPKSDGS